MANLEGIFVKHTRSSGMGKKSQQNLFFSIIGDSAKEYMQIKNREEAMQLELE